MQALNYYRAALTVRKEIGDRRGEAIDLHNIGIIYQEQGNIQAAIDNIRQAIAIFAELHSPYAETNQGLLIELEEMRNKNETLG